MSFVSKDLGCASLAVRRSRCITVLEHLLQGGMNKTALEGQHSVARQLVQQLHCPSPCGAATLQSRGTRRHRSQRKEANIMAIAAEPLVADRKAPAQRPDRDGRFGRFGGKYVSCLCAIEAFHRQPNSQSASASFEACSRDCFTGT